jgi:hypothetical protein
MAIGWQNGREDRYFEYDVTADGKRFLINTTANASAVSAAPPTVVTNWVGAARK